MTRQPAHQGICFDIDTGDGNDHLLAAVQAGHHDLTRTRGVRTRQREAHMKRIPAIGMGTLYFEGFGRYRDKSSMIAQSVDR
jgi:hypothetical protein